LLQPDDATVCESSNVTAGWYRFQNYKNSHMSFYTCFDWFKELRLFVNEQNLRIDIVLKTSRAVVIMCFSLNEAPLGYNFLYSN
jgi:hypothetical protein